MHKHLQWLGVWKADDWATDVMNVWKYDLR